MRLNKNNLKFLPLEVQKPLYERNTLKSSVVHIGVGGFHRAHQAFYQDQLLNMDDTGWSVCGMGLKQADRQMDRVMKEQDCLYTLMVKHPDGSLHLRIIGSITDFIFVPDNPAAAINKLADPQTRIVSLTITEGGYNFGQDGEFMIDDPDIQWDIRHPEAPRTVFGLLSAGLKIRMEKNIPAFTVLSCDNIQHNGDVAGKMLLSFSGEVDKALAEWIQANVSFPNSMVDRITPVTTQQDIDLLYSETGIEDRWPVTCEPFIQWVLEDNFCNGRPAWEKVGVQFTKDIDPFEKMKIRLLNAGHSFLGFTGLLFGYETIDQTVSNPVIQKALRAFMDEEVTPVLDEIEGVNLTAYKDSLIERFKNPNINDQLTRICSESSAKLPKFLIPTIKEQLDVNGQVKFSIFALASWCRLMELYGQEGYNYLLKDEMLELLAHNAKLSASDDPLIFIKIRAVFGELSNNRRFVDTYVNHIEIIRRNDFQEAFNNLMKK